MPTTTSPLADCRTCQHSRPLTLWEKMRRLFRRPRPVIVCTTRCHSFMHDTMIPASLCVNRCIFYARAVDR